MGFTMLLALVMLGTSLLMLAIGFSVSLKNNTIRNKPSLGVRISLALQLFIVLIFALFMVNIITTIPAILFNIVWWGTALSGFIFGVKDFKNNALASVVSILISGCLVVVMVLGLLISAM